LLRPEDIGDDFELRCPRHGWRSLAPEAMHTVGELALHSA
jgi:hypothetical protein